MQLVVRQRPTPFRDLPVDEDVQERVVRLAPQAVEVLLEVLAGLGLDLHRPAHVVLVLHQPHAPDPRVGEVLDPRQLGVSESHLAADHVQREGHGELGDPVAAARLEDVVDQPVRELLHKRIEATDGGRAEREVEQAAERDVVGIVAQRQIRRPRDALLLVQLSEKRRPRGHERALR